MMIEKGDIVTLLKRSLRSKVFENYFSMTSLNIAGALIGIMLYPYLIRTLGKDSYGLYIYMLAIVNFLILIVKFGFTFPAMRQVIENRDDTVIKNQVLSSVFSAKIILSIGIFIFGFLPLCLFLPIIRNNLLIFNICSVQIFTDLLFPQWYFQAIQKMKFVTFINLSFKILTIPFIFVFIKNPADIWIYALIISSSMLIGGISATYILYKEEKVFPRFVFSSNLKSLFANSLPFFWTTAANTVKLQSIPLFIGSFFNFADVAVYELANKIVSIPQMMTSNINISIFPKAVVQKSKTMINKILKYELIIGIATVATIAVFGYWIVLLLGGCELLLAYPLAVILSTTILTSLIVSAHLNFIFIPQNRYYFITQNQLFAFVSFFVIVGIGFLLWKNVMMLAVSLAISAFCEVFYCRYLTKKHNLLVFDKNHSITV